MTETSGIDAPLHFYNNVFLTSFKSRIASHWLNTSYPFIFIEVAYYSSQIKAAYKSSI